MLNQQQQYQERLLFEFIHRLVSVIRKIEKNIPFKLSNAEVYIALCEMHLVHPNLVIDVAAGSTYHWNV